MIEDDKIILLLFLIGVVLLGSAYLLKCAQIWRKHLRRINERRSIVSYGGNVSSVRGISSIRLSTAEVPPVPGKRRKKKKAKLDARLRPHHRPVIPPEEEV